MFKEAAIRTNPLVYHDTNPFSDKEFFYGFSLDRNHTIPSLDRLSDAGRQRHASLLLAALESNISLGVVGLGIQHAILVVVPLLGVTEVQKRYETMQLYSYRHFILASTAHPQHFHRYLNHLVSFVTSLVNALSNIRRDLIISDHKFGSMIQLLEAKWLAHQSSSKIHNAGVDLLVRNLDHADKFNSHSESGLSEELQKLSRLTGDKKLMQRAKDIIPPDVIPNLVNGLGAMGILRGHFNNVQDYNF